MMVNLPCLMVSCTNFLRPTYSFTECQLSFSTGSCPKEKISTGYSSFLLLILLTFSLPKVLINSGRYPLLRLVGHLVDGVFYYFIVIGFLSRTLFNLRMFRNSTRVWTCGAVCLSVCLMLLLIPVSPGVLCPLTSFSDHM